MNFIRRHLALWTVTWLSCQIASLSALALVDAGVVAQNGKTCVQAGPAEQCPMRGANGEPCPMHRGANTDHHEKDGSCTLRSTSEGSAPVFGSLFSAPGVIPVASTIPEVIPVTVLALIDHPLSSVSVLLGTPPPRV
jgi:hypothetical protein